MHRRTEEAQESMCEECGGTGERGADGPVVWQSGIPFETSMREDCEACEGTGRRER